jgi:hypothetical protein
MAWRVFRMPTGRASMSGSGSTTAVRCRNCVRLKRVSAKKLPEPPYTPADKQEVAALVYRHIWQPSASNLL